NLPMSILIPENDLAQDLTPETVVESAYATELAEAASKLQRGLPVLIECDKDLGPFLYLNLRNRLRAVNLRCLYLDGRPRQEGQDYPANAANAYRQLRQATLGGTLEVPSISFDKDIGGYARVKERLRNEILDLIARKEALTNEEQIRALEELIPKGMIFWGPP